MKSVITAPGISGASAGGNIGSTIGPDGSQELTVQQVSVASLDLPQLALPTGANLVGFDPADDNPTPGSVAEQLLTLGGYMAILRSVGAKQIVLTVDASGNPVIGLPQDIDVDSVVTFDTATLRKSAAIHHLGRNGALAPRVNTWGTGAGADATPTAVSIVGTDDFFVLTFTTSASPAAGQTIAAILFGSVFDTGKPPLVQPAGYNAQARNSLAGLTGMAVTGISEAGFALVSVAALSALTTYSVAFNVRGAV